MKKIVSVTLVLTLCIIFCSCGSDKDKLVGAWAGTWQWEGEQISASFVLLEDGQYTRTSGPNGKITHSEVGTWEFKDNAVILHRNGDLNNVAKYEYKDGKLYNGPNEHVKQGVK